MHLLREIDPQVVYIFIFNLLVVDIVKCNLFFKLELPLNYIVCQGYEYLLVNLLRTGYDTLLGLSDFYDKYMQMHDKDEISTKSKSGLMYSKV